MRFKVGKGECTWALKECGTSILTLNENCYLDVRRKRLRTTHGGCTGGIMRII